MKKFLLILLLFGNMVSANSGYYPVTILTNQGFKSFSYCDFNKQCRYIQNNTLNEIQDIKQVIVNKKNNVLLYGTISILGVLTLVSLVLLTIVKMIYNKHIK